MNVLSLFDGMSCGQLALQKAGIKVKQYYASEIDKYAIQVTQHNFPDTIQLGDVTKVKAQDLPKIDLIIGGSPCQGFSFAGKGLNFEDERSKLFFEFVRLIKECKPKYFFLENVKMKKEHELVISQYMKVAPIEVNSALVSAQNRVRLYWTNINEKPYGLFDDMIAYIPQPKDKKILLKDILEAEVSDRYILSDAAVKRLLNIDKDGFKSNIKDGNDKGATVFAQQYKLARGMDLVKCVASRGRNPENQKSREAGLNTEQMLESREDGKTNCLTSVQKDNLVMQLNPSLESGGKQPYQQNRIYDTEGISPALMAQMSCGTHAILDKSPCLHGFEHGTNGQFNKQLLNGGLIRRLTPTECERLQTVPDGYTSCVSDTQRYRMLGNGWTVDVIAHFFVFLKGEEKKLFKTVTEC